MDEGLVFAHGQAVAQRHLFGIVEGNGLVRQLPDQGCQIRIEFLVVDHLVEHTGFFHVLGIDDGGYRQLVSPGGEGVGAGAYGIYTEAGAGDGVRALAGDDQVQINAQLLHPGNHIVHKLNVLSVIVHDKTSPLSTEAMAPGQPQLLQMISSRTRQPNRKESSRMLSSFPWTFGRITSKESPIVRGDSP